MGRHAPLAERLCLKCWVAKPQEAFSSLRARKCNECKQRDSLRECARCHALLPAAEFVWRGHLCSECRADGPPCEFRPCFRCLKVKPPRAFPWGDGSKARDPENAVPRRQHICIECREQEERDREERRRRFRSTWTDDATGRQVRRCAKCGEVKDLETGFYNTRSQVGRTMAQARSYRCKQCQAVDGSARWKRLRKDAEWMQRERAKWREQARRYREQFPERAKAAQDRWEQKVRNDPEWLKQEREYGRIEYRLRREREGKKVRPVASVPGGDKSRGGWLPALPLARAVDRLVQLEEAGNPYDDLPVDPKDHSGGRVEVVCSRLGIHGRTLFAWRSGERERVQFLIADRVLTRSGLAWWDVWNEDTVTDLEILAQVAAEFGEDSRSIA